VALTILTRVSDGARKDATLRITFPKDLSGSHALIEQLARTVDSQHNTIDSQSHTIDELRREKQELNLKIVELIQWAFRNRSERYYTDT